MSRREFHKLVDIDEVEKTVSKYIRLEPLGAEEVHLLDAYGRVLSTDIYSPVDHPPFDRSEVDGYAVRSIDVAGADDLHPVELRLIGSVNVGDYPRGVEVCEKCAAEIATGAMIPRGADSVVMVEYTRRRGDKIAVYRSTYPGENIAVAGSDLSIGDLVLPRGTILGEREIGLLAGLGIDRVKVYKKPRIAVFSTGREIVEPGKPLEPGKVYDVNGYMITTMLRSIGADAEYMGLLPDDYKTIRNAVEEALRSHDMVVTSGGTSAGLGDLVYRVFDDLGEPGVIIHGLKIKPGKPTVFAVVGNKLLVGLPGFPLSCYMVAHRVLKPIVSRLTGAVLPEAYRVEACVPIRISKPLGKTWLVPVALVSTRSGYAAYPVAMKSGSISPLAYADGYMILPSQRDLIEENERVVVELFKPLEKLPELNIIGSNDYLLYKYVGLIGYQSRSRIIPVGSTGGWRSIRRGEADIAPTHLLDEETGKYNTPFLDKMGLRDTAVVIRGYDRRIGILVAPGNPKGIRDIADFLREDVIIVNRMKGSGIRVYLDHMLRRIAEEKNMSFTELTSRIKGYAYEVKTHTAVAAAVAHGRADAGIAAEIAARLYGLDFIPLTWEEYDFLVLRERLEKPAVKRFIENLRSPGFRRLVEETPGYRLPRSAGLPKD